MVDLSLVDSPWMLIAALVLGAAILLLWRPRSTALLPPPPPRLLRLTPPLETPWDPTRAVALMRALVAIPEELVLRIRAEHDQISWEVIVPETAAMRIATIIRSFAPGTKVELLPARPLEQAVIFPLAAEAPFFVPLATAGERRALDPLAAMVGMMTEVAVGEALIWQLHLYPTPAGHYREYAGRMLQDQPWLLGPGMSWPWPAEEVPQSPEERQIVQMVNEKLASALRRTELAVGIVAATTERVGELRDLMQSSLAAFRTDFPLPNGLTWASPADPTLVLGEAEAAALWHLPSAQCQSQQISRGLGLAALPPAVEWSPIPDAARPMGIFEASTKGTGKSYWLAHGLAFKDLLRGLPGVVIDPTGGLITYLLDRVSRMPEGEEKERVLARLRYINMGGEVIDGRRLVVPTPVYYDAGRDDTLYEQVQRYVDVVQRSSPNLDRAAVQGLARIAPQARAVGQVLRALDLGIAHADALISNPKAWERALTEAEQRRPQVAPAVRRLREFADLRDHAEQTGPLKNQLALFQDDELMRATFGGSRPGIPWTEVLDQGLFVLIDMRAVIDRPRRQFMLLWLLTTLLDFIKRRGERKGQTPFTLLIDELSYMIEKGSVNAGVLQADLEELINRLMRSHDVWVTLALQEVHQMPPEMLETLFTMGTLIYGRTSNPASTRLLAQRFYPYDPTLVKYWRSTREGVEPVYYTVQEQEHLFYQRFLKLAPWHFLVGASTREGELPTHLTHVSIEDVGRDVETGEKMFPEHEVVRKLRQSLMAQHGLPIETLLAEIDAQEQHYTQPLPKSTATTIITPTTTNARNTRPTTRKASALDKD